MPRKEYARVRHSFLYHIVNQATGKTKVKKQKARVVLPTKPVTITLEEQHVAKSQGLHGAGRTDLCAGAICALDHKSAFPHKVEGHVDFQYSRLFVVSKVDEMGLPAECYVYEHNAGDIAKLNDSEGGQEKLLAKIQQDGPIQIKLTPYRQRSEQGRRGTHRPVTGARDPSLRHPRGANLRYSTLMLGGYPVPATV